MRTALEWLRTPYVSGARVKGHGCDCLTLLAEVFAEAKIIEPVPIQRYPHDWHLHRSEELYLQGLLKYAHEVEVPKPGDIVLWKFGRCFSHGALVVSWPTIVHAYIGRSVTLESGEADWLHWVGENTKERGKRRERRFFSYWS